MYRALLFCTLLLAGCTDSVAPTDTPVPAAARADVFGMAPEGVAPPDIGAMNDEERRAFGDAMLRMRTDLQRAMATPGGWEAADAQLRPLLDDYPEIPAYQVKQTAGTIMINTYLLRGDMDASKGDALGFYTDLLIESSSPNAPLLERALTALRTHWSDPQIANAARAAITAGERYVAAKADCADCSSVEALRRVQSTATAESRTPQISASIERLRETL